MDYFHYAITILSSAAVGGFLSFVGVFITNRTNSKNLQHSLEHQKANEQQSLLREKGEELYDLICLWMSGLTGYYMRRNYWLDGRISYNELLDMDIKEGASELNFGRIEMIIDIYYPSIRKQYDEVINCRTKLNAIEIRVKQSGTSFTGRHEELENYIGVQREIEKEVQHLKNEIVEAVRKL